MSVAVDEAWDDQLVFPHGYDFSVWAVYLGQGCFEILLFFNALDFPSLQVYFYGGVLHYLDLLLGQ